MIIFRSIRAKFLVTQLSLLLLTILVVSYSNYVSMINSLRASLEQQLIQFAGQIASHVQYDLDSLKKHLERIADSREVEVYSQNFQSGILKEFFVNIADPFSKLSYLNQDGKEEIKVIHGTVSTAYQDLSNTWIIQEVRANPNSVVLSQPYYSSEIDAPALQVAMLRQGYFHDEFIGIVLGTVALKWIKSDLAETRIGKTGFFRLIDRNGTILLSPDSKEVLTTLRIKGDGSAQILARQSGVTEQIINGLDGIVAYVPVPQTDWSILVTLPAREFVDSAQQLQKTILLLAFILFFLSFLLSLYLSTLITNPIKQLIKASERVGKGDFSQKITVSGRDEMGTLAESFNTMTAELTALQQRDKMLTEEKKRSEQKLHRAEKMEAIGLMAGGVAHDLNNILSGVVSYPELLLLQLPQESELRQPLETIKQSGERAAAVVADLLTVARGIASVKEVTSIHSLITTFVDSPECNTLRRRYPNIELSVHCSPETWNIYCSPVHIHKLLLNLITNAFEAISGTGTVTLSCSNQAEELEEDADSVKPHRYVVLEVRDSGDGISDQDMKRIFEPFYSKKVLGRSGTGLGLAVVWSIVQEHDGRICVDSSSHGTVFTVLLPACPNASHQALLPDTSVVDLQGTGTVLVVDDELLQREIAEKMLSSLGYTVSTVSSGEEAIEYLKDQSVDLLLLDMLMEPGMNGRETYAEIIQAHPGQRAIVVSGFSESAEVKATLELGAGEFIKKPYSMEHLGLAVKTVLAQ